MVISIELFLSSGFQSSNDECGYEETIFIQLEKEEKYS